MVRAVLELVSEDRHGDEQWKWHSRKSGYFQEQRTRPVQPSHPSSKHGETRPGLSLGAGNTSSLDGIQSHRNCHRAASDLLRVRLLFRRSSHPPSAHSPAHTLECSMKYLSRE